MLMIPAKGQLKKQGTGFLVSESHSLPLQPEREGYLMIPPKKKDSGYFGGSYLNNK